MGVLSGRVKRWLEEYKKEIKSVNYLYKTNCSCVRSERSWLLRGDAAVREDCIKAKNVCNFAWDFCVWNKSKGVKGDAGAAGARVGGNSRFWFAVYAADSASGS